MSSFNALLLRRHGDRRGPLAWTPGQQSPFGTPSGAAYTAVKPSGKSSLHFSGLSGFAETRSPYGDAHPWPRL